ncbi:hypothetical protein E2C01_084291 [Portunus trituberculatus]|uniref:Uncharacterized protein n=1 Tax=Portunus trituberculatus TaxID=210409 RepID=A0A5B7IXW9_PORTR|nr:hypothetical protein [Portunus trituberculatus]
MGSAGEGTCFCMKNRHLFSIQKTTDSNILGGESRHDVASVKGEITVRCGDTNPW